MTDLNNLKPIIQGMLDLNIVVGPSLSSVGVGGLDEGTYAMIRSEAEYLVRRFWNKPLPVLRADVLVPSSVVVHALCETLSSTAAYLSHLKLGYVNIDESMVRVASRLLEEFGRKHDVVQLHKLTLIVQGYDNYQVLNHYGRVHRNQFVSGELHRPWTHYTLEDELEFMLNVDTVQIDEKDGVQYVRLTPFGYERYTHIRDVLSNSGFLVRRTSLMRLSQFSQLQDYDDLTDRLGDLVTARNMVLEHSGIQPGMRVLELGCGTGSMTINAGLYTLVGDTGQVIATDPSFGMLTRAKRKAFEHGVTTVKFVQSRAEELDFDDNSFDAVVGCSFLHFTDIPTVMKEVHRVAKPGAIFTTYYPLNYSQSSAFFQEWFAPVFMVGNPNQKRDRMPDKTDVPNAMTGLYDQVELWDHGHPINHRNPEDVVRFFVQVGNVFESAFNELPWQAKMDMLAYLVERGRDIVATYPAEELIQFHPHHLIRARVVKPLIHAADREGH